MKNLLLVFLCCALPLVAQEPPKQATPCLIVKRGARLGYEYSPVDSIDLAKLQRTYKRSELKAMEKSGVHVEILPEDYSEAELKRAHRYCSER
jgi:hypothetical protein